MSHVADIRERFERERAEDAHTPPPGWEGVVTVEARFRWDSVPAPTRESFPEVLSAIECGGAFNKGCHAELVWRVGVYIPSSEGCYDDIADQPCESQARVLAVRSMHHLFENLTIPGLRFAKAMAVHAERA